MEEGVKLLLQHHFALFPLATFSFLSLLIDGGIWAVVAADFLRLNSGRYPVGWKEGFKI